MIYSGGIIMNENQLFVKNIVSKLLTEKESNELFKRVKEGDEQAKEKLFEHNIKLVFNEVLNRFKNINYDKKDLVSVGNIGLMKAITTFNPAKKIQFSSYAVRCIDNEILIFLRKIKKEQHLISLDKTHYYDGSGDEFKIIDTICDKTDINKEIMDNVTYQIIREIINDLPDRDRKIIILYFGFGQNDKHSQQKIAKMFDCNYINISRTISKNLKKIRYELVKRKIIEPNTIIQKSKDYNQKEKIKK